MRSALLLAGCVLVVALLLAPFAVAQDWQRRTRRAGARRARFAWRPAGLPKRLARLLGRDASPLAVMLLGMAIRMVPPLGICVVLAAQGAHGREHLAFIVYLLAFYLVTLALETWLT